MRRTLYYFIRYAIYLMQRPFIASDQPVTDAQTFAHNIDGLYRVRTELSNPLGMVSKDIGSYVEDKFLRLNEQILIPDYEPTVSYDCGCFA